MKAEYASANRNLRENNVYQRMGTGGSGAVRRSREFLQAAGANARVRLVQAAAARWSVSPSSCTVDNGKVVHGASGLSLRYGELAADAAKVTLASAPAIKTPEQYTLIGKPVARLDTPPKSHRRRQGSASISACRTVLYVAVVTCPVFGGSVKSYDARAVEGRRGIQAVVAVPGGVAVVADRFWRAKQAVEALPVVWDEGPGRQQPTARQFNADYRAALDGRGSVTARKDGDIAAALASGARGSRRSTRPRTWPTRRWSP